MKVLVITFSPTGNTESLGRKIKSSLIKRGEKVQHIELSNLSGYFETTEKLKLLQDVVEPHEMLILGSPVYANHFQYHMKDLVSILPPPDEKWGKKTAVYVTYGGIDSGIALEEAGRLIKRSGRRNVLGAKVTMSHRMTRVFLDNEFDCSKVEEIERIVELFIDRVQIHSIRDTGDNRKEYAYKSRWDFLKANTIFQEKKWHEKRYPTIYIDRTSCISCSKCVNACPVGHLGQTEERGIQLSKAIKCIHCFNCVASCDKNAVNLDGDLEKAKIFMEKLMAKEKEVPSSSVYE